MKMMVHTFRIFLIILQTCLINSLSWSSSLSSRFQSITHPILSSCKTRQRTDRNRNIERLESKRCTHNSVMIFPACTSKRKLRLYSATDNNDIDDEFASSTTQSSMSLLSSSSSSTLEDNDTNTGKSSITDDKNTVISSSTTTVTAIVSNDESTSSAIMTTILDFPSYFELMKYETGEFLQSEPISITTTTNDGEKRELEFCVKFFPRGGGHNINLGSIFNKEQPKAGFGMAYSSDFIIPPLGGGTNNNKDRSKEKVGIYLQYLPNEYDTNVSIDASFGLTVIGQQQQRKNTNERKFNVEWRAGMRFVPLEKTKLSEGRANDFGANIMQTQMLSSFLGIDDTVDEFSTTSNTTTQIQVDIQIHHLFNTTNDIQLVEKRSTSTIDQLKDILRPSEIRRLVTTTTTTDDTNNRTSAVVHDPDEVRVGRIVVPIATKLSQRALMFEKGIYPGVEYRILRIIDPITNNDLFYSQPNVDYELKPIYSLVPQLERQWPIRINENSIPKLFTPIMYNVVSAIGSLVTAFSALFISFLLSQAISFYYIPSKSMEPTLQIGDVLLVEKVTPQIQKVVSTKFLHKNDIVLFNPPQTLRDVVSNTGGRINDRDLFVKRIAGIVGDTITINKNLRYDITNGHVLINNKIPIEQRNLCEAEPLKLLNKFLPDTEQTITIQSGSVVVLGDCADVSIDSRVWGTLPINNIIGRPIIRLWPLSKFGPVPLLPTTISTTTSPPTTTSNVDKD